VPGSPGEHGRVQANQSAQSISQWRSFEINRKSAEEARLKFDGWLLTLAMLFSDAKRTGEN